jgi:hypothetical protein
MPVPLATRAPCLHVQAASFQALSSTLPSQLKALHTVLIFHFVATEFSQQPQPSTMLRYILLRTFTAAAGAAVSATSLASPPTLCTEAEKTYLTATLSPVDGSPTTQQQNEVPVSAVSLCVHHTERLSHLVLRIGRPGASDTVIRSGPKQRFYTFATEDGPHHGRDVIWLRTGATEYCVTMAFAQGRGIGLDIFTHGQWRYRLFSGADRGVTYDVTGHAELRETVKKQLRRSRDAACV